MLKKERILKILKELKKELKNKYKVKKLGLFGSYVENKQNAESDIDILVEFEDGADLIDFVGLSLFLEEKLNKKVDVVPKTALRDEIKDYILQRVIYT